MTEFDSMLSMLDVDHVSKLLPDLRILFLDYARFQVDLMLLHGPSEPFGNEGGCSALACELNRAQWKAYSAMLGTCYDESVKE